MCCHLECAAFARSHVFVTTSTIADFPMAVDDTARQDLRWKRPGSFEVAKIYVPREIAGQCGDIDQFKGQLVPVAFYQMRLTRIMFETLIVPTIHVAIQAVFSMYASPWDANGGRHKWRGSDFSKPLSNRSMLEAFSSLKTWACQPYHGAVTSPSMKLLVAQSAIFECLWCAQTTRTMFSHAGGRVFFCVEARTAASRERCGHLVLSS